METFLNCIESKSNDHKLFGAEAQRVSSEELQFIFRELKDLIGNYFEEAIPVAHLEHKTDHGDIDILVAPALDIKSLLTTVLGKRLIKFSKNDTVNSFLFKSDLGKTVHIDLITSSSKENLECKKYYYGLNDFSAAIGVLSKKLNFKYGTEGFFKRFKDKKGNWHDILISKNLMDGLKILGFDTNEYNNIKNYDDIVNFILTSPLFDSSFFGNQMLLARDRESVKRRKNFSYIVEQLRKHNKKATITDENYFFKKFYPSQYANYLELSQEIDNKTYTKDNKYDGAWLMNSLGLKPGPKIGLLLKALSSHFGATLPNQNENDVLNFIKNYGTKL